MTSMAFAFLCFTGIFVMFLYLVRNLEKFQEHMRDEHAQLRVQLRALEARLNMPAGEASTQAPHPVHGPPAGESRQPLALTPQGPPADPLMQFEPRR